MFSQEFFIQRSFEVVWAVFRVAEHATRPKIKQALEDRAVDYLVAKDLATLDGLEEIIRLSAQIKDINKVNSSVLLREIGSLRSAILELNDCKARMLAPAKNPETAPNIEESFSRPPMRISEIIKSISDSINKTQPLDGSTKEMDIKTESGKGEIDFKPISKEFNDVSKEVRQESGKDDALRFSKPNSVPVAEVKSAAVFEKKDIFYAPVPEQNENPETLQQAQVGSPATIRQAQVKSPATIRQAQVGSPARASASNTRFEASISFKERNDILVKLLTKRTLCHIKDVLQSMPGISERTIRYDVQRLVDKGVIERIGTGGPNSFFRLKK